ncbi:Hypp8128 [Branchiostoma lanceolatum]|uniref:Hypp8128 protein n=1 Tax=Branchiostoma lanceolatum TaxID=7740 RepID=A0A8J9Z625_BRALA|nr:Hypp8128 [Branchiostoma lanceolatum]
MRPRHTVERLNSTKNQVVAIASRIQEVEEERSGCMPLPDFLPRHVHLPVMLAAEVETDTHLQPPATEESRHLDVIMLDTASNVLVFF